MNGKELAAALRFAGPTYGTLITSPSPRLPAALAGSGLDFVFIDTEHIALDRAELSWMCQTYQQLGMAPLVRIAEPNPNLATMVLDGGAAGVIAPYVETADQVRALVGAVKCRPLKGERLQRYLQGETLESELQQYIEKHNSQHSLVINVESTPAIAALDDLLSVNGLDAVLVGPHDLSCSLGIPEQYDHPQFDQAMQTIIRKARDRQVGAGIHFWGEIAQEVSWLRQGLNMLIHSADISLFVKQLRAELRQIQSKIDPNDNTGEPEPQDMIA